MFICGYYFPASEGNKIEFSRVVEKVISGAGDFSSYNTIELTSETREGKHLETMNTPAGEYKLYAGGTPIAIAKTAYKAKATISLQKYSTVSTGKTVKNDWGQEYITLKPIGLGGTDNFVMKLSELTGKSVPKELELQRGQLVDAMQDSYPYMHGKKFAIWGILTFYWGLCRF